MKMNLINTKIKIHFLGTGSAVPSPHRQNLSLLLTQNKRCILIDCSGSPAQRVLNLGYDLQNVSDIILTHDHTDHIYAFPSFIHSLWLYKGIRSGKSITVHGLKRTIDTAIKIIEILELDQKKDAVDIHWRILDPNSKESIVINLDDWKIKFFLVNHASTPTIGLAFDQVNGQRVLFSGDSVVDEKIKNQITNVTKTLIQDCGGKINGSIGHAGALDINKMIKETNLNKVYLVHLPPITLNEENSILKIITEDFNGSIVIPNDGALIQF